jgi:predicted MFS family arabinose efflux permease
MTLNFWRMCTANLLLFISVYMLFPLLPFVMGEQLGVSVGQAGSMFLVFAVAMFAVGPFHAYLVDEYKRKHVLLYSALIMPSEIKMPSFDKNRVLSLISSLPESR